MFRALRDRLLGWSKKADAEVVEVSVGDSGKRIDPGKMDAALYDLEIALLESDVAFPVVKAIVDTLAEDLRGKRLERGVPLEKGLEVLLRGAIERILGQQTMDFLDFVRTTKRPVVIMFVGVNGTGKTTAIAKVAHLLQRHGLSVVVGAADTFRAGAIEQLEVHANRLGLKLIKHKAGSDPAAVAFDAVEHARARGRDVVLIDTAGRMQTNRNLMEQMQKIRKVAKPDLVVFVGDALAGNDAVEQAKEFHEAVGVDAAILCKIDADAKGGAALSIAYTIRKPILFVGVGQGYEDLQRFDPKWMVDRLFERAAVSA